MSALASAELQAVAQTATRATTQTTPGVDTNAREYLSFRIGQEEYGMDILRVQEIRSYEPPTRIAGAPPAVCGVTNLRGVIVPIVDLRQHFNADPAMTASTVTIVLSVSNRVIGAVVDGVSDVVALTAGQIKPAPRLQSGIGTDCIVGIAPVATAGSGDRMLILLDIEALMGAPELGLSNV